MKFILISFLLVTALLHAQPPRVFTIHTNYVGDVNTYNLVSLSGVYEPSGDDSDIIPDLKNFRYNLGKVLLEGKYRQQVLDGTGVSEDDQLFIYDYATDVAIELNVKDLKLIAGLSPYVSERTVEFYPNDFLIGFELSSRQLQGLSEYCAESFCCFGKTNPFQRGEMTPAVWNKVVAMNDLPLEEITNHVMTSDNGAFLPGNAFESVSGNTRFVVQDVLFSPMESEENSSEAEVICRIVSIYNRETGEYIGEHYIGSDEGATLAPLNNVDPENDESYIQWHGQMFRDLETVILGFTFESFGCERILVADRYDNYIPIYCDPRH